MKTLGGLAFAILALVVGYFWWNSAPPIRYRLTATVESGGRLYTGTGVIQIKILYQEYWTAPLVSRVRGDAIVIDVPDRSPIFVLLSNKGNASLAQFLPFNVFVDRLGRKTPLRQRVNMLATMHDKVALPAKEYPMMVAFRDLNDPASVYQVFPDDLSPPLDPGAHLVGMTIEMTRDRVTYQVEQYLPWITDVHGNLLGKSIVTTSELADRLGPAAFRKRGI